VREREREGDTSHWNEAFSALDRSFSYRVRKLRAPRRNRGAGIRSRLRRPPFVGIEPFEINPSFLDNRRSGWGREGWGGED